MGRTILCMVMVLATVGIREAVTETPGTEGQQPLIVSGRVTPCQWRDALGVYSQPWSVRVAVRYGEEVYAEWSGRADHSGAFETRLDRDGDRPGACVEVVVNGAFLYGDRRVEVWLDEEPPEEDRLDVGTIAMQRQR